MKKIFVVKNGFVLVGDVVESDDPTTVRLINAAVVRRWGTTKGLGELALRGPQPTTTLDPCGDVELERHAILMRVGCVEKSWV